MDGLGPSTTRVSTLAMEGGNVFNLQDFEQNEIPLKQRSFEDSIVTFFSLFYAALLVICNNFARGVYTYDVKVISAINPRTFLVTPLYANLKWGFKLERPRGQDTKCCLRAQTENFCQLHACVHTVLN